MSLLNDMLRDLSQRQPVLDGAEGYDEQLLHTSSITQRKQHSWVPLIGFFIVIFATVLGFSYVMHKFSASSPQEIALPKQADAHTQNASIARISTQVLPISGNAISTSMQTADVDLTTSSIQLDKPMERSSESITIELQNHINDLLQQADRAVGMDRLTTPVEDNAYGYYQKILSMSANNEEAKEGLDTIANRYLIKAQEQAALGNIPQAEALLQRARFVSERFVNAHNIELGEVNNQTLTESSAQSMTDAPATQQFVQPPNESIKPFVVTPASSISVSPNAGWKDEQLAQYAQELIQKGKQAEAQELLKKFVVSEQKPVLSATLLADLYIQQGNTAAADIVIEQAHYLPADSKAKLKAQLLSVNGDNAQAISLLEKNLSTADVNESYRSLLASLYHKTANYQQSILSYQRLMNSFGEKPAYWLGLALAYDGLAQHKNALQAYQRLQEFPQLQVQVKQYTDQRIAALRSE